MVKIRYSELPAGLHVIAEADRRGTVVYLLPGLTPAQRQAALIRVRSSARMGHGPALPALAMAAAIAADRARTTTRNGAAALRGHPMLFLPPLIVVVSSAIALVLMSFVTLNVAPHGTAAAASVPTLGIGAWPSTSRDHHRSRAPAGHHRHRPAGRRRSHHTASPRPSASGSGAEAPAPYRSGPAPWPSSSPTGGSPSPSPGGTCIKLGPLGLCMTI
jgi:hypothetical protein